MSYYQSKFHMYICEFFRWLSFASVIVSLLVFVLALWTDTLTNDQAAKTIATTLAILFASVVIGAIFRSGVDNEEEE